MEQLAIKQVKDYCKSFQKEELCGIIQFVEEKYGGDSKRVEDLCKIVGILLPLNPDSETVVAIFLSELYVEGFMTDDEVTDMFGEEVFKILSALSKMNSVKFFEHDKKSQAEILRKMFLTMAKDLRVILIWLAWRIFQMDKLDEIKDEDTRHAIATETIKIYAPIASRLGVYRIKTMLEDLSFKHINKEAFEDVKNQIRKLGGAHKSKIEEVRSKIEDFLKSKNIEAEITGRIKSIYSIYKKLRKKNLTSLSQIHDFFAIRIILPNTPDGSVEQLYSVLGLIHSEWTPFSERFKDYIAVPKANNYRSLHTVVVGLDERAKDKPVEIQIRDRNMHREAECGIASHWVYKSGKSARGLGSNVSSQAQWLKGLERVHEFFNTEFEGIKGLDIDIFKDRIFVLTPQGEVKDLPKGATPIDFAYFVHTEIGNKCAMSKVNGSIVSLDYELKNGDVVEISTKRGAEPKPKWLSIAKTNLAKNRIKTWFSQQKN